MQTMDKISKKAQNDLSCIFGVCSHSSSCKTCLWNKLIDADYPEQKMYNETIKIMKREIAANIQAKNGTKSRKTTKTTKQSKRK